jgi:GT2 family glycosyltransferase
VHLTGLTLCRGLGAPRDAFAQAGDVDAISGAAFAMRRETFTKLQGFDMDFFLYMEDTDLSWRTRLAGWQIWFTPHSLIRHAYALRLSPRKVFYQERNRYLMLLKCLRWPTLFVLLPALLLAEVITWGFVLWNDRANLGNKLGAYAWISTHWRDIMQKRQTTQALRRIPDRELLRHTSFTLDFEQAAQGLPARLARLAFTPLFAILRAMALGLVWW